MFDLFGVALSKVIPGWLSRSSKNVGLSEKKREKIRRPEIFVTRTFKMLFIRTKERAVLMFAQAVYPMFSWVYVCEETGISFTWWSSPTSGAV